jgi:hypothetical protein
MSLFCDAGGCQGEAIVSTSAQQFTRSPQIHERRLNPRIFPKSLIYVACGENNGGMVLNVCDDGLAISMAIAVGDESYSHLNVRMNGLQHRIELEGRMIWTTKSKKRAGIQLVDVNDTKREQIREWIALEGLRDVNLTPRAVPEKEAISSPVVTAGTVNPMVFAEPRSSLLDAFGGTPPESLGPSLSERFAAEDSAPQTAPSQGFETFNATGFREEEWDLAAVTMVPRKKPRPDGLSAFGLMLLWIAIPSFGIGILVGRRPLEQWLSREKDAVKNVPAISEQKPKTGFASEQSSTNRGVVAETSQAVLPKSDVSAPTFAEPGPSDVNKPERSQPRAAESYQTLAFGERLVDPKLLNSMSTQEAKAFRNSLRAPTDRNPVSANPTVSTNPRGPKSQPAPAAVAVTMIQPGNSIDAKNSRPIAPPTVVASNQNSSAHNGTVTRSSPAGAPTASSPAMSPDSRVTSPANPRSSSVASSGNQNSAVSAKGAPNASPANAAMSRQNGGAPTPAGTASSIMQPPSGTVASTSARYPIHDNVVATAKAPASTGSGSDVASTKAAAVNVAPATTVANSNASTVVSNSNTSASSARMSPSLVGSQPIPASASAGLTPASVQAPLHGVMMVARKNDESFLLKLPAESVPGGKSTSIRMQRFVMVPAESRWHHHGPIAKVTIGELLSQAEVGKGEPGIQAHPGDVVTVRVFVDKEGTVEDLKPMSGRFTLMPRVMRSVRDWQFDQTLIDGKPVESEVDITVEFWPNSQL